MRQFPPYYPDDRSRVVSGTVGAAWGGGALVGDSVWFVVVNRDYRLPRRPRVPWRPVEVVVAEVPSAEQRYV